MAFVYNLLLLLSLETMIIVLIFIQKTKDIHYLDRRILYMLPVTLSIIAMCINPASEWDLFRHYDWLDDIHRSGIGFYDFLFDNEMRIGGSDYIHLTTFNIIRYFIANIGIYKLLAFVMTFITYTIWMYITIDLCNKYKMNGTDIVLSFMLSLTLMPYLFVNSGLRNTTSAAIIALGIYNNLNKNSNIFIFAIFFCLAFTIHPSAIYAALIFLLVRFFNTLKLPLLLLALWTNILPIFANLFLDSEFELLRKIAYSFYIYSEKRFIDIDWYLISAYIILLVILITAFINKQVNNNNKMINFVTLMSINAFFNIGYTQLALRPIYTLGVLSTPVLYYTYVIQSKKLKIIFFSLILLTFLIVERISIPEYLVLNYFD